VELSPGERSLHAELGVLVGDPLLVEGEVEQGRQALHHPDDVLAALQTINQSKSFSFNWS
jgi:hypothetical protein